MQVLSSPNLAVQYWPHTNKPEVVGGGSGVRGITYLFHGVIFVVFGVRFIVFGAVIVWSHSHYVWFMAPGIWGTRLALGYSERGAFARVGLFIT